VLNQSPGVSDQTRRRVMAVIEELDYRPSRIARSLSLRRTMTIGVVVPFCTHASSVERLSGITHVTADTGYDLVLYDVECYERESQRRAVAAAGRADGAIVVSLPVTDDEVSRFAARGTPLVLLDSAHPSVPSLVVDDVRGGRLATRHLIQLGHRRIGFVGDPPTNAYGFTSSGDRLSGHLVELEAAGLERRPEYIKQGTHDKAIASQLAEELLSLPEPPTAIFAASDTQALGVLDAARRAGADVPSSLSVIGFDDIEVARYVGLTTVRQELTRSGENAAALLLDLLAGVAVTTATQPLTLELISRETTAPPARMTREDQ
jgi:LacI family transcriptional regulator